MTFLLKTNLVVGFHAAPINLWKIMKVHTAMVL